MPVLGRDAMVTQSLQDYLRVGLFTDRGFSEAQVGLKDAFPTNDTLGGVLDKNYIAAGFNFDDGGEPIETGSNLMRRTVTVEFFTFALNAEFGEMLADTIRAIIQPGPIPLKDVEAIGQPVIDYLELLPRGAVTVARVPVRDPRPWEEFLWLTKVKVWDEYDADTD